MRTTWKCSEHVKCNEHAMSMSWKCNEMQQHAMEMRWKCKEHAREVEWHWVKMQWTCDENAVNIALKIVLHAIHMQGKDFEKTMKMQSKGMCWNTMSMLRMRCNAMEMPWNRMRVQWAWSKHVWEMQCKL